MPQKPYLPIGTLREALLYPQQQTVSDDALQAVLAEVGLERLAGQLETVEDWQQTLSGGEQQRVAFARILLRRPRWLFLDEASSALDEPSEQQLYVLLRARLPDTAIVSVGHRSTLAAFHARHLRLDGRGGWQVADALTERLKAFLKAPQVTVFLKEVHSKKIVLIGQVRSPGTINYVEGMTLEQAVSMVGGLTPMAARERVRVNRVAGGKAETLILNFKAISEGAQTFFLQPGDTISVDERLF